ncbi:glycine--tRNA ligase subunit beta [Helicobacter monodelphidis]|uniref:glycine--tRNA ligase subunit beta n=1 Tax=Helicobacter sp. 15-1451 TaxID=2004995 RepID=UPI000DCBDEC8|nr:glycine--tRNA ligase subunit beta [Helicobacter sp. 15-1451]RAX56867.1 glycine--tRNA ligase subunit beta [Helicobacter sp. 15-1451]
MTDLLIEIGTEELPAIPFLKEKPQILQKFYQILKEYRLECECMFFYTPRRIVILSKQFPVQQQNTTEEFFGPPKQVAYNGNQPTKAFESFLKKCNITAEEVSFIQKEGKEVLYFKRAVRGKKSEDILQEIVKKFINSLNFGKSMRWGSLEESFIRPIRSLSVLLANKPVFMEIYGIQNEAKTFVHRSKTFDKVSFTSIQDYQNKLSSMGVILDPVARRERILNQIQAIEQAEGIQVELDLELLEEIVAITEYPNALLGRFEEKFLKLPPPMIVTSMKENQRYFATYKGGKLFNGFIVVSNALSDDFALIVKGNERVLRARLSDALFFYNNDLKNGFKTEQLESVRFIEGLGSMLEKSQREAKIVQILGERYQQELVKQLQKKHNEVMGLLAETSLIAKGDLMSESVYEFTELQGVIGSYMAEHLGFSKYTVDALFDQYLPKMQNDPLPRHLFSALFSLAYRLDNLMSLFSIQRIPSGSKDPFSLRRAANGIIRIVAHEKISFPLTEIFTTIAPLYQKFDLNELEKFVLERLDSFMDVNPSLITAVLKSGERDIYAIIQKIDALQKVLAKIDNKELNATFKRVANITKDMDLQILKAVNTEILYATEERELFNQFSSIQMQQFDSYVQEIESLMALKPLLDRFFNVVLVNAPDEALRENRKTLIALIYKAFLRIADMTEIAF